MYLHSIDRTLWYESGMLKYRITVDYIAEASVRDVSIHSERAHFDTDERLREKTSWMLTEMIWIRNYL